MKTLFVGIFATLLLASCDPNSDKQVGNRDRFNSLTANNGSGGGGNTGGGGGSQSGTGTTTDAPLDGGLSVLLLAGAAYGARRMRQAKKDRNNAV